MRELEQFQRQAVAVGAAAAVEIAARLQHEDHAIKLVHAPPERPGERRYRHPVGLAGHELEDVERLLGSRHRVAALAGGGDVFVRCGFGGRVVI